MFHFVHLDLQRAGRRLSPWFANPRDHHDSILRMDTFPNMPSAFSPYDGLAPNTHINSSLEMVRIVVGHKLGLTAYRIGILVEMHQSRGVDTVAVAIFVSHKAKVSPFGIFFPGMKDFLPFCRRHPSFDMSTALLLEVVRAASQSSPIPSQPNGFWVTNDGRQNSLLYIVANRPPAKACGKARRVTKRVW